MRLASILAALTPVFKIAFWCIPAVLVYSFFAIPWTRWVDESPWWGLGMLAILCVLWIWGKAFKALRAMDKDVR